VPGTIDAMDDLGDRDGPSGDGGGGSRRRLADGQAVRVDPTTGLTDAELAEKHQGFEEHKGDDNDTA
jgi:hypothetical protein